MITKKNNFCDKDFIFYEVLGQGGFAVVHRAKCLNSKIPANFVAIKKIRKENFRGSERKGRAIKEEFKIHSRLNHPNIIKLYGKYEDQKYVYLILELCSKGSLEDYLKQEGRLKEAEACRFFKQIVEGILYLHEQLVIHRDIALKNILLSENKTAKLADFGLSVEVTHADDARRTMVGTPSFMPPEVVMNESHTLKRDCWSLGCVLYSLLVGKSPFNGQSINEVLTNVMMQGVTFPDDMSREAKELISCLLEKEDSKRPRIKDILEYDFFKKYEKDDPRRKLYRNGDSGTGSMGSSAISCSKMSHHYKTSDSGMDSINSGSAELKRNSENTRKFRKYKCLDTIHSLGFLSESIKKAERSSILRNSNRERPLPVDDDHKEYLPSCSHSNVFKSENTACSHEHFCHCHKKVPSTSQLVQNTNKPTESSKTKSLSDITEPLNTSRLSPMRKMLRKAKVVISISNEGRVFVEHFKKNKVVTLIFEISPDGKAISLYAPKEESKVSDKPLSRRNCHFKKGYSFEHFPEQHFKFYVLAKKTVDIVRAKTAKVIFFGKEGKCVMMENGPCPDYQMEFTNGGMVKKTSNEISYIDENGIDHLLFSGGEFDKKYENIWKDFLTMQEQCELVGEHLKPLEESDIFPVICGKRPENVLPIENNKENLKSQSCSLYSLKNDENRTISNAHTSTSRYNPVPLEKNNCLTRNIDEILVKLKRKPQVEKDCIIAEYFDGYQLRCSKDGTNFSFFDPCNHKIKSLNSILKRRLQQDLLGILVYIGEEDEKRRQSKY